MSYDIPPNRLDHELVFDFFWKFSVFECALKREGFLRSDRHGAAQPDWTKFEESIRGRFGEVHTSGFQASLLTLKDASPRQQIVREGQLGWEPIERKDGDWDEQFVLRLVRTARNNLFHGGKYPDGPVEEVARDKAILRAALGVLEGCYDLHPGIARWIHEAT